MLLERNGWYSYFENADECEACFIELEQEAYTWIRDFFLHDSTLEVPQKVRILQILVPHWLDLLSGFDPSQAEELEAFHFTPQTCQIILFELWLLDESQQQEITTILEWNEHLIAGCIKEKTKGHKQTIAQIYQKIIQSLHPNSIKENAQETVRQWIHFSRREYRETIEMLKIYILHIQNEDSRDPEKLKQAHRQARDIMRMLILVPIFAPPFGAALVYALNKIAKKMNITLMPSESFEADEEKPKNPKKQ